MFNPLLCLMILNALYGSVVLFPYILYVVVRLRQTVRNEAGVITTAIILLRVMSQKLLLTLTSDLLQNKTKQKNMVLKCMCHSC